MKSNTPSFSRPLRCFALALATAVSTTAAEMPLTIETATRHAVAHNADLAAAQWTVAEARGRLTQAGRWSNPELEGEFAPHVRGRESTLTVGFSQRFPLTARLRLERTVARTHVQIAEAEVRNVTRQLCLQVRETAVRSIALATEITLREQQIANAQALASTLRRAAEAGEGSPIDADHLDLELARLESRRLQSLAAQAETHGHLLLLLGLPPETTLVWTETLADPATLTMPESAGDVRPDLAAARARAVAANQAVDLARAHRWEDVRVGLFGEVNRAEDAPVGVETDTLLGMRLALPLPLWNRGRGRLEEAAATAARAEQETTALQQRVEAEARAARRQGNTSLRLAESISQNLLPKARRLEERLMEHHRAGQTPFAEVLRARERRLELETALAETHRDFHLARVRLLAAQGVLETP
ncbi:MAG: TolC family protein [Verrucomicrobiales bacterium]|nr:TolC family protein [Verrucomicrobiales bacterium]